MKTMKINRFTELRVYQTAKSLAMEIFELSKSFPPHERYSLTDQIRRSSRSVCANLAEAWRKRRYPAAFIAKLNDAEGEANETMVWIAFAGRCGYVHDEIVKQLSDRYDHILAQLFLISRNSKDWLLR